MLKILAVLGLLLIPGVARADFVTIVTVLGTALGGTATAVAIAAFVATYGFTIAVIALNVYGASSARRKARDAAARGRSEFNSNLIDRLATLVQPNPAWRVVYGRCITGGDIVAMFTSDKVGTRADGTTYTKGDAYRHLVIHVATHEVEAINDMLIEGVRIGTLDADGWVKSTSTGTGTDYSLSSSRLVGNTSIPVAGGTGTIVAGDEISFNGDSTRYVATSGITGPGQTLTIAAPGLLQDCLAGTKIVVGNEFAKTRVDSLNVDLAAGASVTLPTPINAIISASYTEGTGDDARVVGVSASLSADKRTITNTDGVAATVTYTVNTVLSSVRIKKHLGSPTQTVDLLLNSMFPAQWTANHRLQGMAYVVVTLDLEEPRFQGGPPPMAFDISGKKVFDPRSGLTAFSSNPSLIINDFLQSPWGFECAASDVNQAYCIAAANACDVATNFTSLDSLGSTVTRTMPLYTTNGAFTTADSPEALLDRLAESMAGYAMYGGEWLIVPGTWTAPVMDLTDNDLDGQVSIVQAGAGMDSLFNGAHASYLQFGRTSPSDIRPYQNATFLAADGRELWSDYTLAFTDDAVRARNIVRIFTERNRDGLIIQYPGKLNTWPLRVGGRVRVTNAEYGFANKYFRVTDWQFGIGTSVNLTLQEDSPEAYDQADATKADPTPNTTLPNPNIVGAIQGLTAASGTAHLIRLGDGSIVPRVYLSWNPVTAAYVVPGGRIEVSWQLAGENSWTTQGVAGDELGTYITGVKDEVLIILRVVVINSLRVRSSPVYISHRVIGKTAPPQNVTGLARSIARSGVRFDWTSGRNELDYESTELRLGSTWAAATPIFRGNADTWTFVSAPVGTYTVLAKHYDTSQNPSVTAASVSVTVTALEAVQWADIVGRPKLYRVASAGYGATTQPIGAGVYDGDTGTLLVGAARSYGMARISRSTGAIVFAQLYDVYSNGTDPGNPPGYPRGFADLAADLNASGSDVVVVVWTADEPLSNHLNPGLAAAMYRCGASPTRYGSPQFKNRGAFVLVGIGGCGEGNGFECYAGKVDNDINAWCDVSFSVQAGNLIVTGTSSTPSTLADYSYTGTLDATTDLALISRGVVLNGNTATKLAGGGLWDADVYSRDSFTGGAYASIVVTRNDRDVMFGLNSDPLSDASYTSLDFAIYMRGDGLIDIYGNAGAGLASGISTYAPGDVLATVYDGVTFKALRNGAVIFSLATSAGLVLFFDSSFNNAGSTLKNIRFGPMSSVTGISTGQLQAGAVTDEVQTITAGPFTPALATYMEIIRASYGPYPGPTVIDVTFDGYVDWQFRSGFVGPVPPSVYTSVAHLESSQGDSTGTLKNNTTRVTSDAGFSIFGSTYTTYLPANTTGFIRLVETNTFRDASSGRSNWYDLRLKAVVRKR